MSELKEEGWVKFIRFNCKAGHIDKWFGDMIDNPNNPKENNLSLNSSDSYFRLNDKEWINRDEFDRTFQLIIAEMCNDFNAEEIWNTYKIYK